MVCFSRSYPLGYLLNPALPKGASSLLHSGYRGLFPTARLLVHRHKAPTVFGWLKYTIFFGVLIYFWLWLSVFLVMTDCSAFPVPSREAHVGGGYRGSLFSSPRSHGVPIYGLGYRTPAYTQIIG